MTPNTLWPCSCVIDYTTLKGAHKMTIPLRAWSPVSSGHPSGTNLDWNSTQVDTHDMIDGLIDLLRVFQDSACSFNGYTINTYDAVNAPARPQIAASLTGKIGTGSTTIPASQATWNFKTQDFGAFKLVLLDTAVSATFNPLSTLVSPANDSQIAVRDYLMDDANAFSGRDNTKPNILRKITYTLNDKLREEYNLN